MTERDRNTRPCYDTEGRDPIDRPIIFEVTFACESMSRWINKGPYYVWALTEAEALTKAEAMLPRKYEIDDLDSSYGVPCWDATWKQQDVRPQCAHD